MSSARAGASPDRTHTSLSQKGTAMTVRILATVLALALATTTLAQSNDRATLEIVARGHVFELSADEIPSGWTTLRLRNETDEPHFALFGLMPAGRGVEDSVRDVVPVFQDAMDLIMAGRVEDGFAALGALPEWYGDVV